MRGIISIASVAVLALAFPAAADVFNMAGGTISLQFVTVGNPGNAPDTRYNGKSVGNVSYVYDVGKFETTAGQYCEFLNAVAKTDTYGLYNYHMDRDAELTGCNIKRTGSSGSYAYSVASDWASRPVNWVSWGSAARFANWLTNGQPVGDQNATTTEDGSYLLNGVTDFSQLMAVTRKTVAEGVHYYIPTRDEWYKAAYHKNDGVTGNYWNYPTATDARPSNKLLAVDGGNNANFYDNSYTIGAPYRRTVVGDF